MLKFLLFAYILGNFEICSHKCTIKALGFPLLCIFDNAIPADQIC